MTLAAQGQMVNDDGLLRRIAAAAAYHGVMNALPWAVDHAWLVTATDGWSQRYAAATSNDPPIDPAAWFGVHGADPEVITDEMILSAVQNVLSKEPV